MKVKKSLPTRALGAILSASLIFNNQLGFCLNYADWDKPYDGSRGMPVERLGSQPEFRPSADTPSQSTSELPSRRETVESLLSPEEAKKGLSGEDTGRPLNDKEKSSGDLPIRGFERTGLNTNNGTVRGNVTERKYSEMSDSMRGEIKDALKSVGTKEAKDIVAKMEAFDKTGDKKDDVKLNFRFESSKGSDGKVVNKVTVFDKIGDKEVNLKPTGDHGQSQSATKSNSPVNKKEIKSNQQTEETSTKEIKSFPAKTGSETPEVKDTDNTHPSETNVKTSTVEESVSSEPKSVVDKVKDFLANLIPNSNATGSLQTSSQESKPATQTPGPEAPINSVENKPLPLSPVISNLGPGSSDLNSNINQVPAHAVALAPAQDQQKNPQPAASTNNASPASTNEPEKQPENVSSPGNNSAPPAFSLNEGGNVRTTNNQSNIRGQDEIPFAQMTEQKIGTNYSQSNTNNIAPPLMLSQKETSQSETGVGKPTHQEFSFKDTKTGAEMRVVKETDGNTTRSTIYRQDGQNLVPVKQMEKVTNGNATITTTSIRDGDKWVPMRQMVVTTENGKVRSVETKQANSDGTATHLVQQFDGIGRGVQYKTTYLQNGQVNMEKTEAYGKNYGVRYTATGTFDAKEDTVTQMTPWKIDESTDRTVLRYLFGGIKESNLGIAKEGSEWGVALLASRWGGAKTFQTTLGALKLAGDTYLMTGGDPNVDAGTLVTDVIIGALPFAGKIPGVSGTGVGQGLNALYENSMPGYLKQMLPMAGSFAGLESLGFSHLITGDFKGLIDRWKSPATVVGETVSGFGNGLTLGGPAGKTSINIFGNAGKIVAEKGITGAAISAVTGEKVTVGIPELLGRGTKVVFNSEKAQAWVQGGGKMLETAAGMSALQRGAEKGTEKGFESLGAPQGVQKAVGALVGAGSLWVYPGGNNSRNAPSKFESVSKMTLVGYMDGKPVMRPAFSAPAPGATAITKTMVEQSRAKSVSLGLDKVQGGIIAKLDHLVNKLGLNTEHGITVIRNKSTGELGIIPDFLGIGHGAEVQKHSGGEDAAGAYDRHPQQLKMAETLLKEGWEIVGPGHTHPLAQGYKDRPSGSDFTTAGEFVYIPGSNELWEVKAVRTSDPAPPTSEGWTMEKTLHKYPDGSMYSHHYRILKEGHGEMNSGQLASGNAQPSVKMQRLDAKKIIVTQSEVQNANAPDKITITKSELGMKQGNVVTRAVDFVKGIFGGNAKSEQTQNRHEENRVLSSHVPELPKLSGTREQVVQQVKSFHEALNSISGTENQLKALTTKYGNNEWGYRIVQNQQTGQQRVVVDLAAPGSGMGGGPNGFGAYQGTSHSKSIMDSAMRPGEVVVGEGHTHIGNTPLSHQDFDSYAPNDGPAFVYIPGNPQAGIAPIHLQFTSTYVQSGSRQEMVSQGWQEYRNFYETGKDYYRPIVKDGSRLKWDDFDAYHFVRPVDPNRLR